MKYKKLLASNNVGVYLQATYGCENRGIGARSLTYYNCTTWCV